MVRGIQGNDRESCSSERVILPGNPLRAGLTISKTRAMPSKYEIETKEIEFMISLTTHILILFVLILFIFSIIFPQQNMLILTLIFVIAVGAFILNTKNKIKLWKSKWYK